jgi:hypothetical protein
MSDTEPEVKEFRFNLGDAYTPDTFPMKRLADYLRDIAEMFGEEEHVHFVRLEEGSTIAVARTEVQYVPVVEENIQAVVRGEAPPARLDAYRRTKQRFWEDKVDGYIVNPRNRKVIEFPSLQATELEAVPDLVFGTFAQLDTIEGTPILVGGKQNIVHIHLRDRQGNIGIADADQSLAKRIAEYLFDPNVILRVDGIARYMRHPDGEWERKSFRASDFTLLRVTTIDEDIAKLAAIPAKWKELEDPLHELDLIRHEDDVQ